MKYRLGKTYIDKASKLDPQDQFMRWININGSGMLNSPGIRPLKYITNLSKSDLPAYMVLVTNEKTTGKLNPWDDVIDFSKSEILYWGDAKFDNSKKIDDFKGNKILRIIYNYILKGQTSLIPPILHFSKPSRGLIKFNGLCILNKLDITWFDDDNSAVQNYLAKLIILDCEKVSIEWLHSRVKCSVEDKIDSHKDCPKSWNEYKKGRKKPIDIWAKKIRKDTEQLPATESSDSKILGNLCKLEPYDFEKIIVALFQELTEITHHISGTSSTRDGGFDFFGKFILPRPVRYEIKFRGEVKRYSRKTGVDPKSVSRLVARLSRGEYGIFVTTSYFTKQAQKEVLSDNYPIHLISGIDLIYMLKHQGKIAQGQIRKEWLDTVLNNE